MLAGVWIVDLTLSASLRSAALPKGELFGSAAKLAATRQSSPLGGAGTASAVTERVIRFKNGVQPLSEGRTTRKRKQMSETILTAENLKFRYDSEQPVYALDGVSTSVKRGEFVAVLGANGCGKSTLAKHFNAILLPESGKVYVEGMDTSDDSKLYDIRQTVGMVFQNPDNQIVATVVEEDVAFALENLGVPPDEMRRRVDESMKMAGIYEFRERAPHNLSGGQKQRVAIAGVVAMRPDCLILDEATAMLDPRGREQVMQTIHHLNKNMGITVVSITHYM